MYHFRHEDVLLCEAFANAQDVFLEDKIKNPTIEITLEKTSFGGYVNFHNNGTPMTKIQFKKYHEIAGSAKIKGGGIGFAGVGAKVFLAAPSGGEIFTITGENTSKFLASQMLRTENDVGYDEITDLSEIFVKNQYRHKYGTTYRVRLNDNAFQYMKKELEKRIQFWWNFALLRKQFTVIVDGKKIEPFDPKVRFRKSFTWKKHKIDCYCWISRTEIPEERRHIVYAVHGKRINNEIISTPIQLKEGYWNRVFCLVDVSHLAKHIRTDKESFGGNWETNGTKQTTQKFFIEFLQQQGLTTKENSSRVQTTEIVNEFTKELDRLLKTKDFKDLNPFLAPRKRMVPKPNKEGSIDLSEVAGGPVSDEGKNSKGQGNDNEQDEGTAHVEDEEGNITGKRVERRSKGIRIIPTDEFPNEKEQAWVDLPRGAVVINILHPFYITMKDSDRFGKFEKFNIHRVLIEALIKFKNDELKEDWDPRKTLNMFSDLLQKTWNG
tara:strand:+ start:1611 stop:3089 length:1479 start_codon:yes stop_codon:yes gene_type:complete